MTTPGPQDPGQQPPSGGAGWGPPAGGPQQPGTPQPGSPQPGSVPPPPPGQYPPPQQGSFPQGQYPPQGQPPQGQPPQGQFPQGQGWTPPQQPQGGAGKWLAIGGGVLVVVVIAVLAFAFLAGGKPEAGDCLRADGQDVSRVDCDDEDAQYRLIGIQEGTQTQDEYFADPNTCSAFPEATQSFWIGDIEDTSADGEVYCVTSN